MAAQEPARSWRRAFFSAAMRENEQGGHAAMADHRETPSGYGKHPYEHSQHEVDTEELQGDRLFVLLNMDSK